MNADHVKTTIERTIQEIAGQHALKLPALKEHLEFVDGLGFTSLLVAELVANLEEAFGIDPFQDENVMITDIRTINDLCKVYVASLQKTAGN